MPVNKISRAKLFEQLQMQLAKSAIIAATVRDLSSQVEVGDESINLPYDLPRTAQVSTVGAVNLTANANQLKPDVMLLNKMASDRVILDIGVELENVFSGNSLFLKNTSRAIVRALEVDIITKAIAGAKLSETSRTSDIYNDLVDLRKAMKAGLVPFDGEVYVCLTPTDEALMLKNGKLTPYQKRGDGSAIEDAIIGQIAGFKVLTPDADASFTESFAYHGQGIAFAWHSDYLFQSVDVPGTAKQDIAIHRKFNSKLLQDGAMVYKWGVTTP